MGRPLRTRPLGGDEISFLKASVFRAYPNDAGDAPCHGAFGLAADHFLGVYPSALRDSIPTG